MRQLTFLDQLIINFDQGLHTLLGHAQGASRDNPAATVAETELSEHEKHLSTRLMRINHAGEVSAQALYQGQALTARTPQVRDKLRQFAQEETDHLLWCQSRIKTLGGHRSLLNPFWYSGSLALGTLAGLRGDKWSLGFVAETERQVVKHLEKHLQRLPAHDFKSQAILEQMKHDETRHGSTALRAGGVRLPKPVGWLMSGAARVMTTTAYWL